MKPDDTTQAAIEAAANEWVAGDDTLCGPRRDFEAGAEWGIAYARKELQAAAGAGFDYYAFQTWAAQYRDTWMHPPTDEASARWAHDRAVAICMAKVELLNKENAELKRQIAHIMGMD